MPPLPFKQDTQDKARCLPSLVSLGPERKACLSLSGIYWMLGTAKHPGEAVLGKDHRDRADWKRHSPSFLTAQPPAQPAVAHLIQPSQHLRILDTYGWKEGERS